MFYSFVVFAILWAGAWTPHNVKRGRMERAQPANWIVDPERPALRRQRPKPKAAWPDGYWIIYEETRTT